MKSRVEVRPATRSDFIRFYGIAPPEKWGGLTAVNDRLVLGVGGVCVAEDGTHWVFVDAVPAARLPSLFHRRAVRYLNGLAAHEIKVLCDERFLKAKIWLERLGFTETNETINGCKVWNRINGRIRSAA